MIKRFCRTRSARRNISNLFIVGALWLLVSGCVFSAGRSATKSAPNANAANAANIANAANSGGGGASPEPAAARAGKKTDAGDFVVRRAAAPPPRFAALDERVRSEKLLEKAADDLNRALVLPNDIALTADACGEANAEFDPQTQTIRICFELMEHFQSLYESDGMRPEAAEKKMFDAVRFAFLHEVGHALIDNYRLPLTGNEEEAADRCASYINLEELGATGVEAVLAAADAFRIESKNASAGRRELADEHLLREQRFYNSLCMIYGSAPDRFEYLVGGGYLPRERADRCPAEYRKTVDSWKDLLGPWRRRSD